MAHLIKQYDYRTVDVFLVAMRERLKTPQECLTEQQLSLVFGNIEQILGFSTELLKALTERVRFSLLGFVS